MTEPGEGPSCVPIDVNRLPESYGEFCELGMRERRAVYSMLTPAFRARLWNEHLDEYLRRRPDVSPAQRQIIEDARNLLERLAADPRRPADSPELHEELVAMRSKAEAAFGGSEARNLFATLGPPE